MSKIRYTFNPLADIGLQLLNFHKNTSGYVNINDTTHDTNNRVVLVPNTDNVLPIIADSVDDEFAPLGRKKDDVFDDNTHRIKASVVGEIGLLRIRFTADPNINNRNCTIKVDIGTDETPIIIWDKTIRLARGAGVDTKVSETLSEFKKSTYIQNGARILVNIDGDCEVYDFKVNILTVNIPQ